MNQLMQEALVHFELNGQPQPPFLCTPENLEELAAGYLLTSGRIKSLSEIGSILLSKKGLEVTTKAPPLPASFINRRLEGLAPNDSQLRLPLSTLRESTRNLLSQERYFGTHRIMITGPMGELCMEDVGRHNAADKAIAAALQAGYDLSSCALGATGRISLEILSKAASVGIPILFTKKYASDLSQQTAARLNLAIVQRMQAQQPDCQGACWRVDLLA